MKTMEDAIRLAETMVAIGEHAGKRTVAMITEMGIPLGRAIGNSLEVIEAVQTLKGEGPKDLYAVCRSLAAEMMMLAGAMKRLRLQQWMTRSHPEERWRRCGRWLRHREEMSR